MLFKINDKKEEVIGYNFIEKNLYYGIFSFEEFKELYQFFSIDSSLIVKYNDLNGISYNTVVFHHDYLSGCLNFFEDKRLFLKKDHFIFFIFKNIFLIVVSNQCENVYSVFCDVFKQVDEKNVSITKLVYMFFDRLIVDDYKYINNIQEELEELEKYNTQEDTTIFIGKIKRINKELAMFRHYYENLMSIGEELQIGYYSLVDDNNIKYMDVFVHRVSRLLNNVELLQELSVQLRDMHQSQLDYSMNKTMEFFTIVTSIFMPLTLITGWYGMNFKYMPELNYEYGYYVVIGISVSIVVFLIYWFKKKKYF